MRFSSIVHCSCSDWPGQVAVVLFTQGCNMRCHYCANYASFEKKSSDFDGQRALELLRTTPLTHVVLCGGEPTIQPHLEDFCRILKEIGWHIKLDTNGTNPDVLQKCLPYVDYIAVDVKTTPSRYFYLTNNIISFPDLFRVLDNAPVTVEYRTTLVRDPYVSLTSVTQLQYFLEDRNWTFNRNIISPGYSGEQLPWTEEAWASLCRQLRRIQ